MNYSDYYTSIKKIQKQLTEYVLRRNEVDGIYHTAKIFLQELNEKANQNLECFNASKEWVFKGGTLNLKKALEFTSFEENNLAHFNAFALLDSVRL